MPLLEIVLYPDPILSQVAKKVEDINDDIKALLEDMAQTMYEAPGIGLAAPQIGKSLRMLVVDVDSGEQEQGKNLLKLINPEIIERKGKAKGEEGCLSIPDIREQVVRDEIVKIKALDISGQEIVIEADGLLSVCLQHEIDHLDGVLFIDKLSKVRKELIKGKLKKLVKKRK